MENRLCQVLLFVPFAAKPTESTTGYFLIRTGCFGMWLWIFFEFQYQSQSIDEIRWLVGAPQRTQWINRKEIAGKDSSRRAFWQSLTRFVVARGWWTETRGKTESKSLPHRNQCAHMRCNSSQSCWYWCPSDSQMIFFTFENSDRSLARSAAMWISSWCSSIRDFWRLFFLSREFEELIEIERSSPLERYNQVRTLDFALI